MCEQLEKNDFNVTEDVDAGTTSAVNAETRDWISYAQPGDALNRKVTRLFRSVPITGF